MCESDSRTVSAIYWESMSKRGTLKFLGCVWLVACGGKQVEGRAPADAGAPGAGVSSAGASSGSAGAGASSAGASSGSAGTVGNGPDSAGAGGAFPACPDDPYIPCTDWCGRLGVDFTAGECVNGALRCPAPLFDPQTCPSDACVLQGVWCCDHEFGKISLPECTADGKFGPCPTGFERDAKVCVADSAHTSNCGSLIDQACTLAGALCDAGGAYCECRLGEGGLRWNCAFDLL